ncbi:hypothetical protein AAEX28_04965 [Lentisphaerota bacterium WC36G]|nr:hypothetical protein LJT99_07820 [Lentisphaerae bacterium WC36]
MNIIKNLESALVKHGAEHTASTLGDRTKYIGMSDIAKGAECLRSAVAGKLGVKGKNNCLNKQLILQRGHWFEGGLVEALRGNSQPFFEQLEIAVNVDGVPIKGHLDMVFLSADEIHVVEVKSMEVIPNEIYQSYKMQLYAQLGFLEKYFNEPCFSLQDSHVEILHQSLTLSEIVEQTFNMKLSSNPSIKGSILAVSMTEAKSFDGFEPDANRTLQAELIAKEIWQNSQELLNGHKTLNDVEYCLKFYPLCDWCEVQNNCPKFTAVKLANDNFDSFINDLKQMKIDKKKLAELIKIKENNLIKFYQNNNLINDWLETVNYRFKVSDINGRNTINIKELCKEIKLIIGESQVETLIQKHTKQGNPYSRLQISKL